MAIHKLIVFLAIVALASTENEVKTENKAKKTMEAEKEQKLRSASPANSHGSFHKLTALMNHTEDRRQSRRKQKDNLNKILQMNRRHDDMMNDNEGIPVNQKTPDNDTTLTDKIKILRPIPPMYEPENKYNEDSQATGVFCNFEPGDAMDLCSWQWNSTVSKHGLGFSVVTPEELITFNNTTKGLQFSGPETDADGDPKGHFLYLAVDPTMENMVIKSPPFRGLWEFCKFEVYFHQRLMHDATIKLISETTTIYPEPLQLILQEVTGSNAEKWYPMRFTIGKVQQVVRINIEIARPKYVSLTQPLPHIAIDNIRMLDCVPEPPVYHGDCSSDKLKCNILSRESCIDSHQVCDLVKDCDDGSDEHRSCDKMPFGSYCNFDQDNCGFVDIPHSILKWTRHTGPTPTANTGPTADHTCGIRDNKTTPLPPLLPAHMNFPCIGYYFLVNMNVTGPDNKKPDFASTAVMRSVIFNPPPKVHGDKASKYYNCCMIRFYYEQYGRNYGSLSVDVVELTTRGNVSTSVWFSTKDKGESWYRAAIFLPNVTGRYYIQFTTRMGMRIYSDSAVDDFSMAPECFGLNIDPKELGDYNYYDPIFEENVIPHKDFVDRVYYRFTTCGATGPYGPDQMMCDAAYNNTPVQVRVLDTPPYSGVQVWEVPEEGLYTIIATGASGGLGSSWAGVSHGAQARALFEFHKNEVIYMVIGQRGINACKKALSAQESQECARKLPNDTQPIYTSKTHEVRNTEVIDGGGGGGGGTYVFLIEKDGQAFPLVVAGGGGGISMGIFRDDGSQHGKPHTNATPESGYMYGTPKKTSGAGGGWISRPGPTTPGFERIRGAALNEGARGGEACVGDAAGGFGGGGGGCLMGGAGGGYLGGSTNEGEHGGGGWSYIDGSRAQRMYSDVSTAIRTGPGEVLIIPAIHDCGCDYRCVVLNEFRSEVRCYCPSSWVFNPVDPAKCVYPNTWLTVEGEWSSFTWTVVASGIFCILLGALVSLSLILYNRYQRKRESRQAQKRILEQEVQLHRLRNAPGANDNALSMAFNPHYGSESILPQGIDVRGLPQVSRESLKLVKALGQGAFGEVYQGLYRHRSADTAEMPVAVKTLPELSTGQAESDFLMEAAIMAKFNHANIVHLIGVCFDRHPRFIVLELLAGGDLKNFLRESRPKPERASALTMKDLLLCSLDVCKGCRYLETKRFIHRDIAARNCLLTSRGPGRVVKIADFGMARDIYRADYYKKGGKAMLPIKWMPPEAYIDGVFTTKTDVWSFGVLLWEVFSLGVMPYTGCANREVMELVSGGGRLEKPYAGCPPEIYRLMCECWNPTPTDRPSFAAMTEMLQRFIQDPAIVNAPLPIVRSLLPATHTVPIANGQQPSAACDYLVPMSPQDATQHDSSTEMLGAHSKQPPATRNQEEEEDLQYLPLLRASQEYGNIRISAEPNGKRVDAVVSAEIKNTNKFLPSNSTDRLLSSVEGVQLDEESLSEVDEKPVVWETSFSDPPPPVLPKPHIDNGPAVEKLISITPTSPKPPENALTKAIDANVIDKTNHKNALVPDRKTAPIASPDPPRINAWSQDPPKLKPKPLCLDAAKLEQNLNALKKNSGSVNLNTMNILPPYINVVTPNKLSEKTIQIDPKKAVIDDCKTKLKQSNSAASLLNGPMTDVPYADSDNTSSSSSNNTKNGRKVKQGSEDVVDSEISC